MINIKAQARGEKCCAEGFDDIKGYMIYGILDFSEAKEKAPCNAQGVGSTSL